MVDVDTGHRYQVLFDGEAALQTDTFDVDPASTGAVDLSDVERILTPTAPGFVGLNGHRGERSGNIDLNISEAPIAITLGPGEPI